MKNSLNIAEIHALDNLSSALNKYSQNVSADLHSVEIEITRILSWLQERKFHWTREIARIEQEIRYLQQELSRCLNSGYVDRDGNYHAPDCSRIQFSLQRAQINLHTVQENLQIAIKWESRIEQAVVEYKKDVNRQSEVITTP
jgi:hypothetical protein